MTATKTLSPNVRAFLDMIAWAEGTIDIGDNGYNVLFGATVKEPKLFDSYADHPRVKTYETHDNFIKNDKLDFTTAAGRYQIIKGMYDVVRKRIGLKDFSPESQDSIALYLIKEKCNINLIENGKIERAVGLVSPIWASLPLSKTVQRKRTMAECLRSFTAYGGRLEGNVFFTKGA